MSLEVQILATLRYFATGLFQVPSLTYFHDSPSIIKTNSLNFKTEKAGSTTYLKFKIVLVTKQITTCCYHNFQD